MEIRRTSETQAGQIYMPQVNWLLLAGVLVLTLAFNSSERLAAAYGIAVTGEMIVTTLLAFIVIWKLWKAPPWLAVLLCTPFFLIENVFLASNMTKVWSGGFVPILLALGLCTVMWTWTRGTRLLSETVRRDEPRPPR
jgi:KUP system potassium uptake protein